MLRVLRTIGAVCALSFVLSANAACSKEEGFTINGWEPKQGPQEGGGTVVITGTGFQADGARGVTAYFGDRKARVLGWDGDERLRLEAPPGEPGKTVDILLVFDAGGNKTLEKAYTYQDMQKGMNIDGLTEGTTGAGAAAPTPTEGATPPATPPAGQ